jgi:hypothetical protein
MAKIIPITERYQHFLAEMKESFWGDLYGHTQVAWKRALEAESEWERPRAQVRPPELATKTDLPPQEAAG